MALDTVPVEALEYFIVPVTPMYILAQNVVVVSGAALAVVYAEPPFSLAVYNL